MWKKILYSPFSRLFVGLAVILTVSSLIELGLAELFNYFTVDWKVSSFTIFAALAILLPLCYKALYHWYEKREITELSSNGFLKQSGTGFLTGFLYISAVVAVSWLAGGYTITGIHIDSFLFLFFVISLSIGIVEELLIRGIVFRLVEEKLGTWIALILSAFIFGFLHSWNEGATVMSSVAISLEAGVLLAAAYVYTRNLWFPIFLHTAWNFACGNVYGLPVSGEKPGESLFTNEVAGSDWITGGAFGPENSIQAILFGLLLGGIFLVLAKRKGHFIEPFWKQKEVVTNHAEQLDNRKD